MKSNNQAEMKMIKVYAIQASRECAGIVTNRELLNQSPRLTKLQREYGWKVTGIVRPVEVENTGFASFVQSHIGG